MVNDPQGAQNNDLNLGNYTYEEIASKNIAELLGVEMPQEKLQKLEDKMVATAQKRTIVRIVDMLADEDIETWETLTNETAKEEFLAKRNINVGKIVLEETLIHKLEMLSLGNVMKDKITANV